MNIFIRIAYIIFLIFDSVTHPFYMRQRRLSVCPFAYIREIKMRPLSAFFEVESILFINYLVASHLLLASYHFIAGISCRYRKYVFKAEKDEVK